MLLQELDVPAAPLREGLGPYQKAVKLDVAATDHYQTSSSVWGTVPIPAAVAAAAAVKPPKPMARQSTLGHFRAPSNHYRTMNQQHEEVFLISKAQLREREEARARAEQVLAHHLGNEARTELAEAKAAASRVQGATRGHQARSVQEEAKAAAGRVQAIQRGNQARRESEDKKKAATKVQAVRRGEKARGEQKAEKMKKSVRYY